MYSSLGSGVADDADGLARAFASAGIGLGALALTGCRAKVKATDLEDTGNGNGGPGLGTLTINAMSKESAEGTDHVDMTIDRVEVHIADASVQDDVGAEWLVLSEDEQVVPLVELKPQSHEIASGDAPEGSYDQVKLHIKRAGRRMGMSWR